MTWPFSREWRLMRHLKNHERERKQLEDRLQELEQIKISARQQLKELEDDLNLWNSVQLDK
jgi:chromosome segregation ATPase